MEKFYHPELHIAICSSLTLHMPPPHTEIAIAAAKALKLI